MQALTVEQVAEQLQVHPSTVRRLLESGHLEGVHVGRVWRISPEALEQFMAPHTTDAVPSAEAVASVDDRIRAWYQTWIARAEQQGDHDLANQLRRDLDAALMELAEA